MVSYAWSIISLLGIVYALKLFSSFLLQIHAGLQAYVLPWVIKSPDFRVKFGEWGLVTGCTQGIGREYALGLAAKGMDVLLVSRNKKKLLAKNWVQGQTSRSSCWCMPMGKRKVWL